MQANLQLFVKSNECSCEDIDFKRFEYKDKVLVHYPHNSETALVFNQKNETFSKC